MVELSQHEWGSDVSCYPCIDDDSTVEEVAGDANKSIKETVLGVDVVGFVPHHQDRMYCCPSVFVAVAGNLTQLNANELPLKSFPQRRCWNVSDTEE